MATVNKKFSVKNGLAVDGNVAVSGITSFVVDGPSSSSLTFTLSNITSATINGSNIATQGWVGDQNYLTSFTETDPVFVASEAYNITSTDTSNWDTAYGWGDHGTAGYLTTFTETDPVFVASEAYNITSTDTSNWDTAYGWGDHSVAGYLTTFTETDPVFVASEAYNITSTDTSNWDTAYGWGDHSVAGYLTTFTETDPVFTASEAYNITSTDTTNWDTAYGWGDHGTAGYLTTAVESIATGGDNNIVFSTSTGAVTANLASNVTIGQDLTVTGNLTVNGNTTTLNTETLTVEDNVIVLNKNVTGTPSLDAGIEVERGSYTNSKFYWNETANAWYISTPEDSANAAVEAQVATLADLGSLTDAAIISANASATSGTPTVYSWAGATYSTAKFTIQMKQGGNIHVLEILAAIAGSSVYVTEYAEVISNAALGETDVTYDGTTAVLTVTPTSGTVATKIVAQLIEA